MTGESKFTRNAAKNTSFFERGKTLTVKVDSPLYVMLKTHPANKDRVDEIVIWNCKGYLGKRS